MVCPPEGATREGYSNPGSLDPAALCVWPGALGCVGRRVGQVCIGTPGGSLRTPVPYWVVTLGGLPLLLTAPHLHLPPPSGEASGAGVRGCGYIDGGDGRVCGGCLTSGLVPLRMYRSHVPTIRADHTYLSHEPTTRADHTLRPHVLTTHADHTCRPHVPTTRTDHTSYFIADPTRRSHVPITRTRADHTYRPHAPHRPHVPITRADHT